MQRTIQGKRIRSLKHIDKFNIETLEIGVQDINGRAEKIGLKSFEEIIVPSPDFGPCCEKNANGYSYADKTKEKKRRYICTNWIHPYGNENADSIPCDIYRECYPRIEVAPTEIGLTLHLNEKNERYIIACLTPEIREKHLISTINLFLELFGECTIFECLSTIGDEIKRHRCNWEILPPGEAPGKHFAKQLRLHGERTDTFNIFRLTNIARIGNIPAVL